MAPLLKNGPALSTPVLTPPALARSLQTMLEREGADAVIATLQRLCEMGYNSAARSGASLSAFAGEKLALPPAPSGAEPGAWQDYLETVNEMILAGGDYTDPRMGPQRLFARLGVGWRHLPLLLAPRGPVAQADLAEVDGLEVRLPTHSTGETIVRHSLVEGWRPEEMMASVAISRLGFAQLAFQGERILEDTGASEGQGVLARARRARRPGIVFARAAASGEVDPLEEPLSRILIE
jgi:hypothetical protein